MRERSHGEKQIIEAAKRLFLMKGFHQVSTSEIIKEAQVAKGTLYHHFPSKQHLAVAVVGEILEEEILTLSGIDFTQGDPWASFADYLYQLGLQARKRESSVMLLFQLTTAITDEDASTSLEEIINNLFMETSTLGQVLGLVKQDLMNVFLALIDGFVVHVWLRPHYYDDDRIRSFVNAIISLFSDEVKINE